ncbi:MAG: hypothetical protein G8345_02885 [Magnetococcales bacterium]|nr:hypothetical protein [Magnetococcales bacterium]NGZ25818.1 hypothetical protein [Magnetococcales bacterium]
MKAFLRNPQAPYPVTHSLHVAHSELSRVTPSIIAGLHGVLSAHYDEDASVLTITYDLRRTHMSELESVLREMGVSLEHGFWSDLHHKIVLTLEEMEDVKQYSISHMPENPNDPFLYRKLQEKEARMLIRNRWHQPEVNTARNS